MVSDQIRKMTAWHWIFLFAGILVAWGVLMVMSVPADTRNLGDLYGAEFWRSLCAVTPDLAGFLRIFAMWALMSFAMMAPTAFPSFATYEDLGRSTEINFARLVIGYCVVWFGFSAFAAALQLGLFQAGLINLFGDSQSLGLSALLLAVAGTYQFTPIKDACLAKCRQPLTFFMQHFEEGPLRNGIRLGLVCVGCCWALMLLAFVGGVMNVAFMGLATLLMVFEKMPDIGRYVTRPLGGILLAWAGYLILSLVV